MNFEHAALPTALIIALSHHSRGEGSCGDWKERCCASLCPLGSRLLS